MKKRADEMKKLAIIKNDKELLRIIPFKCENNLVDFKIALLKNDYRVYFWRMGEYIPFSGSAQEEVTYRSEGGIVHIKNPSANLRDRYGLTFDKVIGADINTEFPLPILKMTCKQGSNMIYKRKDYHFTVDLDNNDHKQANTVEVYLGHKDYNYREHSQKWPILNALMSLAPIDYVVKGVDIRKDIERDFTLGRTLLLGEAFVFENFQLICKTYYNEKINENSLCFYENKDYLDMLATTPICLADKNYKPYTRIFPAYARDLKIQLDEGVSRDKLNMWENIFKSSLKRLNSEKLNRKVMVIPQY